MLHYSKETILIVSFILKISMFNVSIDCNDCSKTFHEPKVFIIFDQDILIIGNPTADSELFMVDT